MEFRLETVTFHSLHQLNSSVGNRHNRLIRVDCLVRTNDREQIRSRLSRHFLCCSDFQLMSHDSRFSQFIAHLLHLTSFSVQSTLLKYENRSLLQLLQLSGNLRRIYAKVKFLGKVAFKSKNFAVHRFTTVPSTSTEHSASSGRVRV
jgi:hypothetical protein